MVKTRRLVSTEGQCREEEETEKTRFYSDIKKGPQGPFFRLVRDESQDIKREIKQLREQTRECQKSKHKKDQLKGYCEESPNKVKHISDLQGPAPGNQPGRTRTLSNGPCAHARAGTVDKNTENGPMPALLTSAFDALRGTVQEHRV